MYASQNINMNRRRKETELEFKEYFEHNTHKALSRSVFLEKEIPLHMARDLLKREFIEQHIALNMPSSKKHAMGYVDMRIRWRGIEYLVEVKYFNEYRRVKTEFWESLKILGYLEMYKWEYNVGKIKPAIMIPLKGIRLEHKIIANKLKIALFGIEKQKKDWIVLPINFN